MSISLPSSELSEDELYPYNDGKPMGESDIHIEEILALRSALGRFLAARPDAYVAANNFLYYRKGSPRAVVSPDGYVVFGVEKRRRKTYMTWKEGDITPAVVFEVTSESTREADTDKKFDLYEQILQIPEYFLFDPTGDYLDPQLLGYRLNAGLYMPIQPDTTPLPGMPPERQPAYHLHSEQLGLDLACIEGHLRLYDVLTGKLVPTDVELAAQVIEAQQRAEAAEAELARLKAELAALKRGM
jgi:Uma2 family endonuclease